MKKHFVLGLLICISLPVYAQTQTKPQLCNTIEKCLKLKAEVQAHLTEVQAHLTEAQAQLTEVQAQLTELFNTTTPVLTETLGREVSQYEAAEICKSKGMRLPSIRELALAAKAYEAEGGYSGWNYYWSSSVRHPDEVGYLMSLRNGEIITQYSHMNFYVDYHGNNYTEFSVKCVVGRYK